MAIKIKDHKVLMGMMEVPFHRCIIGLVAWVVVRHHETVFTSGYRKGDEGVHGTIPCRGIDIRSTTMEDPEKVVEDINKYWIYDPTRLDKKCALYHDAGSGFHIHLQAHDRTEYKKEKEQ